MSAKEFQIAVIPGDGIGKEVVPEAIRFMEALAEQYPSCTCHRGLTRLLPRPSIFADTPFLADPGTNSPPFLFAII
jgi:isocitrate dehydrogenase